MKAPGFAQALDEYEALLDQAEAALESGDWSSFDGGPGELPEIVGNLDPSLEQRAAALITRAAEVRARLEGAARDVADQLNDDAQRAEAHRRYVGS